ncbi:MAG: DUF1501 domain-containing protein [Pirellulaceae bacterium]
MSAFNRRELMRMGGISLAGLSLSSLMEAEAIAAPTSSNGSFGRAKNIIFLYLNGGPPQHETFDPKPDAPAEVRGPFNPIQTNIPGIQFCELLPRTAAIADKLAVVRSMATDDNIHSSSGHWVLTGYKYQGPNARTIQPTDWPYFGSLIKRYRPSETMPALSAVWVPDVIRLNDNVTPAGQTGGMMGSQWTPERFIGDPAQPNYKIQGLEPLGITSQRLRERQSLLSQLEDRVRHVEKSRSVDLFNTYQRQAYDLLTSGRARKAFAIHEEPEAVRNRYGRNRWGQCVLLARRLIESGVRLVHVNWPREPGDNAVDNPLWDTHAQNHDRLEDVLCPIFDVGFSALIEDLDQRGLLEETLVVAIGEFGRTPKINSKAGRDHWGSVFSFAMAGAGIRGGQVYGSSDSQGAYPKTNRVEPGHLTASIFHLMGLNYQGTFSDPSGRELSLTQQAPIWELLGTRPATDQRLPSSGDVTRVPPFDEKRILANNDFSGVKPILPATSPSRPKGWRSLGPLLAANEHPFGLRVAPPVQLATLQLNQHLAIGIDQTRAGQEVEIAANTKLLVGQEVRSPFAGTYRLTVDLVAEADDPALFKKLFEKHFECSVLYFQLMDKAKQITSIKPLATVSFSPTLVDLQQPKLQRLELVKEFVNPTPGSNFSFGLGMGIGLQLQKKTAGTLKVSMSRSLLRVTRVELEFLGKEVNQDVTV